MSDIRIERVVERVYLCVGALGPEEHKEPRYQVTYHMYLASLHTEQYVKRSLLVLQIFAIFRLRHLT